MFSQRNNGNEPHDGNEHITTVVSTHESPFPSGHILKKNDDDMVTVCIFGCCGGLLILLLLGVFLALPITQLVMVAKYSDQIICNSFLQPKVWLIVKAVTDLFVIICCCFICSAKFTENRCILAMASILFVPFLFASVFELVWLIIGSVMFWRDCLHMDPEPINTLMWCSLIIGYVFLLKSCSGKSNKEK